MYAVLALVAAGCSADVTSEAPRQADPAPTATTGAPFRAGDRVPPIRVRGQGRELVLVPWSSCWDSATGGACADGRPPANPPDIGDPAELEVDFPTADWRFTATAARTGEACGREQTVELVATGPTTHRLVPIGPKGDYTITLFGRSNDGAAQRGDVAATFRWHTPRPGPNERPTATASIIAGAPGQPRSFGVEVMARALGLPTRKATVRASVLVTSANGASLTIDLQPRAPGPDCVPDGMLFLDGPPELGTRAAALGPAPFRYLVTLVLDSVTYRGRGTWPDDEMAACSPCTALQFDPPLPAS